MTFLGALTKDTKEKEPVESKVFGKYLHAISKVTGRDRIDDFIVELYWDALKDSKEGALEAAMKVYFTKSKWPSIDDLKAQMGEKTTSIEDKAKQVAAEITEMIMKKGYCAEAEVMKDLSPVAHTIVLRAGGWSRMCAVDNKDLAWRQKDWMNEAETLLSTGRLSSLLGPARPLVDVVSDMVRDVGTHKKHQGASLSERFKAIKTPLVR